MPVGSIGLCLPVQLGFLKSRGELLLYLLPYICVTVFISHPNFGYAMVLKVLTRMHNAKSIAFFCSESI